MFPSNEASYSEKNKQKGECFEDDSLFFFAFIADVITVRDCTVNYNNTPQFEKSHFHQADF